MSQVACPVSGCKEKREHNQVMCKRHWFQVPIELRRDIWAHARVGVSCPSWAQACREAIAHVEAQASEATAQTPSLFDSPTSN